MESQEQREERQEKSKKGAKIAAALVAAAVIGGGVYAYTNGLIPGIGASQTAEELKADIEALKGSAFETKVLAAYEKTKLVTEEDKKQMRETLANEFDLTFDYKSLTAQGEGGRGTVIIEQPLMTVISTQKNEPGFVSAPKLVISRDSADRNHYFYHTEGDLEVFGEVEGTKTKLVSIAAEQPYNEVKFSEDGLTGYFKSTSKNLRLIEGRGNTTLLTVGDAHFESSQKFAADSLEATTKIELKNITPGDMAKMMLGNTEPFSFVMDYEYKGEDVNRKLQEWVAAREMGNSEIKPFDGSVKFKEFSILMGDAGINAAAILDFKKTNPKAIPVGTVVVTLKQYQKLIDFISSRTPFPVNEAQKLVGFLSEIGENANGDITVKINFDGTENITVKGKSLKELLELFQVKNKAPVLNENGEITAPEAPAKVESKPIE